MFVWSGVGLFLELSQCVMADLDAAAHQAVDEKLGIIPAFSVKSQEIVFNCFCLFWFVPEMLSTLDYFWNIIYKYTELQ